MIKNFQLDCPHYGLRRLSLNSNRLSIYGAHLTPCLISLSLNRNSIFCIENEQEFRDLEELNLENQNVSDKIDIRLNRIPSLAHANLSRCNLSKHFIPFSHSNKELKSLDISYSSISRLDSLFLPLYQGNVCYLSLKGNELENIEPLSYMRSLRLLDLSDNRLKDPVHIILIVQKLRHLENLDLRYLK